MRPKCGFVTMLGFTNNFSTLSPRRVTPCELCDDAAMPTSPSLTAGAVRAALAASADADKAKTLARFFKTGPGEYAEGDVFVGVTVPVQRKIARTFRGLPLAEVTKLLASKVHEERLTALLLLVDTFTRGDDETRRAVVDLYLANLRRVNNWDLVDSSAPQILGAWLLTRDRDVVYKLAASDNLWERRVAMVSTYAFIRAGEHADTFELARRLMHDEHDLMHKAAGWMLREVGKRVGAELLRGFLKEHAGALPRTALRYAIEHFSPAERARWMKAPMPRTAT